MIIDILRNEPMGLLPDTQHCGLLMHREWQERFPRHRGLAIPAWITARASRTCHDAGRGRQLSSEVGDGKNFPGIPSACATRSFSYLVRGPWNLCMEVKAMRRILYITCMYNLQVCLHNHRGLAKPHGAWVVVKTLALVMACCLTASGLLDYLCKSYL